MDHRRLSSASLADPIRTRDSPIFAIRSDGDADDVWRAGRDLEVVLDGPRQMTTLVQTTDQQSLSLTLPLARQIINQCDNGTIAVPVWRKHTTPVPESSSAKQIATEKFERHYKDIKVGSLQLPAQEGLEILKSELLQRFFDDKRISDRDLIALKLDPSVNTKPVLVDKALLCPSRARVQRDVLEDGEGARQGQVAEQAEEDEVPSLGP